MRIEHSADTEYSITDINANDFHTLRDAVEDAIRKRIGSLTITQSEGGRISSVALDAMATLRFLDELISRMNTKIEEVHG